MPDQTQDSQDAPKPQQESPQAEEALQPEQVVQGEEAVTAEEATHIEEAGEIEEAGDGLPEYGIQTEDVGVLKKKVTVTVPRDRIEAKRDEMFGELAKTALVPGFRIGHAPRRLIEKRFGKDVSQDVRNSLVGESLTSVIEKAKLNTVGEPDLDLDAIQLPEDGDMQYSFEVEVAPEFELPETTGIPLKRPKVEITDERIDQVLNEFRQQYSTYEPSEGPAGRNDMVTADAKISGEGIDPLEEKDLNLRVAPGQVEGLPLVDLGNQLEGKKPGDSAQLAVKVPLAHPRETWREKELTVELTVKSIQARKLPELNDQFAQQMGVDGIDELRSAVRGNMQARLDSEIQQALRDQTVQYLLDNVKIDVPAGAAERQTARLVQRRYMDLLYRGVPREQIDERLTELQAAASEEAVRELKVSFILGQIAQNEKIEIGDEEINARIAAMAHQASPPDGRVVRPERLKQDMQADGSLASLAGAIAEQKALDILIERATITEQEEAPAQGEQEQAAEPAAEPGEAESQADEKPAE
ncbi:MAG: Trigger factor [Planctomycetes bacterium ADurb.Bin126]|nr:MAG: Trigger factor [Planctomycetes bacterium ADurb.Bin126]HOD82304.1 trigger factor [Phycisphaerae bacterium]HQL74893.1 trigger factor [Phycisphaerae bacterium]